MKSLMLAAVACMVFAFANPVLAQQFDASFGVDTLNGISETSPTVSGLGSITGGAYPVFGVNVLLKHNLGFNGEVSWRASQGLYLGYQPFRPIFFDFNAIYAPQINKRVGAELVAGIGAESLRFYQPFFNCNFVSCTNYVSSNHFLGDFGGGIKFYVHGNFFVRPEARLYLINNNVEFSSGKAVRYGISIGYTARPMQ
ncbi:MAG TPA: hypothetical protein VFA89_09425 [Terriglobales bacterium]|nr:hypothetical protein [Terriglobales bacterium]